MRLRYWSLCSLLVGMAFGFVVTAQDAPKAPSCEDHVAQVVTGLQREKLLPETPALSVTDALQLLVGQMHTAATKLEFVKQRADLDLNNVATLVTQVQSLQRANQTLQQQLDKLRSQ